jgi:predicted HicB family RNase H-like nuclease
MSTKQQIRRKTKQIRIDEQLHRLLKLEAVKQNKTISKFADEIIKGYLEPAEIDHENSR